jgi:hypothetical protein
MYRISSNIIRVSQVGGAGGEDEQGDDGLNADERAEARREEELKKSNFVFVQETNEDTIFDNHEMSAEVGHETCATVEALRMLSSLVPAYFKWAAGCE